MTSHNTVKVLDITIKHCDELSSLITGINFMLKQSNAEVFRVQHETYVQDGVREHVRIGRTSYPYLLVNIGSGVSILKVYREGRYERVGGTSLGGSTFYGLCCMLTNCASFEEALALAEKGNAQNVDLLVEDIYGGDYEEFDLPGDTVACSLGKLANPEVRAKAAPEDLARATLDAITNNVGSLALLHAKAHNTPEIIFAGNFLRKNKVSVARLSYAVGYWSKNARHASFLTHEGYLGAFGALLTQLGSFETPATSPERGERGERGASAEILAKAAAAAGAAAATSLGGGHASGKDGE
jgi:type II pantothenate kinase